jgi:alcohol dehydrogenase class IV
MFAAFSIEMVGKSLRRAVAKGSFFIQDRYNMAIAASFAMLAMSATGPGLAHLGNETLGAMAGLSHGRATGLLLPEVMQFNLMTDPAKFAAIAELLGEETAGMSDVEAGEMSVEAVRRLLFDLDMPQTLTEVGVDEDKVPELAKELAETRGPAVKMFACREITIAQATELYLNLL